MEMMGIASIPELRAMPWGRWLTWLAAITGHDPNDAAHTTERTVNADFEAFVALYERQILNYLWRMTGDEDAAYDLTQETFLRAWRHFAQVQGYAEPRGWLFRVATNLALSFRQRRAVAAHRIVSLPEDGGPAASDPGRMVAERDQVREVLLALPPRRRAALVLREVYGIPAGEVAEILGMSRDALKMLLSRTREQFRTLYAAEEAAE
jgi:RNA polymerase sigma-70 factor, ECF subfamily